MELTIDREECELLLQVLQRALGGLREEIGKTENYEYRQELHRDEERLKAIIDRLSTPAASR